MFKSIVVAVDGSDQSFRALEIGAELAARDDARLGLVYVVDNNHMAISEDLIHMAEVEHVIQPSVSNVPTNFENLPFSVTKTMGETAANSQRVLYQVADHIVGRAECDAREAGANNITTSVEIGQPADRIVAFSKKQDADLIITGRRGLGRMKSLLLGSTSHKISQLVNCSAMTVN
jgi:nucleotide-binding universal stress UspA family protein